MAMSEAAAECTCPTGWCVPWCPTCGRAVPVGMVRELRHSDRDECPNNAGGCV